MATAKTEEAVKPEVATPDEERVPVFVPRGDKEDPNLYVSVNEYTALLPRGKTSMVPPYVAAEIERSLREQERYLDLQESMQSKD